MRRSSVQAAGSAAAILATSQIHTALATPHGGEDHGGAVPKSHPQLPSNAQNIDDDAVYTSDMYTIGYVPFGHAPVILRNDPELCFSACQTALRGPTYTDVAPDANFLYKECHSTLMQTSIFLCVRSNCRDSTTDGSFDYRTMAGLVRLNETCTKYMNAPLPSLDSVLDQYTDDVMARMRRLQRYESDPATNVSEPVITTEQLYENSYDTLSSWAYVHGHHSGYGRLMFFFWCAVIFYGMASRLFSAVSRRLRRRRNWLAPTIGNHKGPSGGRYEQLQDTTNEEQPFESVNIDAEDNGLQTDGNRLRQVGRHVASRPGVWLQRYVVLPATFGYKCAQDFGWYTVPPRVQTLTLAAFTAINIYACFTGYRVFTGNMWWPEISRQYYRYVSDRTGILSFVNFPLIWLFGMRNNALLWLTGWDFGTYNNFHRWIARIATVEAIVHSIGYTILVCRDGGWSEFLIWWQLFWWWTGGVATILMSLLLGFSIFWMRRRFYELFLIIHIVFSVFIILGMVGHVSIFRGQYDFFWLSASAIWILDRVLRAARVLAFNPLFWRTRAKVTYDPQANIVRIAVPYTSSFYQPQPGTYYYLHVLNDKRFWESHPFTVATVASLNKGLASGDAFGSKHSKHSRKARKAQVLELAEQASPMSVSSSTPLEISNEQADSPYESGQQQGSESTGLLRGTTYGINQSYQKLYHQEDADEDDDDKEDDEPQRPSTSASAVSALSVPPSTPAHAASALTFLVRPYDGFTSRLRDYASGLKGGSDSKQAFTPLPSSADIDAETDMDADTNSTATVRVLVDGPYGHSHRFDDGSYDSVLFIVGGSGIVVPMSHLTGIGHERMVAEFASYSSVGKESHRRRLRSVHVVWAVREAEFAAGVLREDLQGVFDSQDTTGVHVSLDIYVTRRGDSDGETESVLGDLPPSVRVLYDRPDVRGEIECAAKRDTARGRLGVVACGPGRMADEARRTVVDVIGRRGTTSDVEYLEESFQW
ncbi:ferric-chelate reductase [Ophiostoma piceae UAMH 11346]|uniref:Ferric-chelate reductase n=1 Tax=Ophiostoma piceae (strain UAMH 11346) TaxID=1262450 RepID=S3CKJ5_OPHP1|nr:ferric-chelate reductase [Ophiostoma piceae UAMH 11346]